MHKWERKRVDVDVRGQAVTLEEPTEAELQGYAAEHLTDEGRPVPGREKECRAQLLVLCIIDPDTGKRAYGDGHVPEITTSWPAGVISQLHRAAAELCGITKAAADHLEDARKN